MDIASRIALSRTSTHHDGARPYPSRRPKASSGSTSSRSTHKVIGVQYFITGLLFLLIAGSFAELVRIQLMDPKGTFMSYTPYNQMYTMHGTAMVWLVLIPLVTGALGNFVMPLQIGARDVAFPWLNMVSFWLVPLSGLTLFSSFLRSGRAGRRLDGISADLAAAGHGRRALVPGDHPRRDQLDADRAELRRHDHEDARAGHDLDAHAALHVGDVLDRADQHDRDRRALGRAAGAVPRAGRSTCRSSMRPAAEARCSTSTCSGSTRIPPCTSSSCRRSAWSPEIMPTFARKPIFGYKMIAFSSLAIAILGFSVWAHHMFPSGISPWLQIPFMILTYAIGIPTGIKIFSWLATLWGGRIQFTTPMMYVLAFLMTFTFGGITGIFLASVPVDFHEHGSYFVVAHFHYVVGGGAVLGFFAAVTYWFPKVTGQDAQRAARQAGVLAVLHRSERARSCRCTGSGSRGCRAATLRTSTSRRPIPMRCSGTGSKRSSSFLMVASVALFAVNLIVSLRSGRQARQQPVGRAHARMDDQLAAAVLQLQEDSDRSPAARTISAQPLPYLNLDNEVDPYPAPSRGASLRPAAIDRGRGVSWRATLRRRRSRGSPARCSTIARRRRDALSRRRSGLRGDARHAAHGLLALPGRRLRPVLVIHLRLFVPAHVGAAVAADRRRQAASVSRRSVRAR